MIIGFTHRPGAGGPGSFQSRLEQELNAAGVEVAYLGESDQQPDAILLIGGTRKLVRLARFKWKRVPIVLRLDGILWLHRKRWPGFGHFCKKEIINLIFQIEHAVFSDCVVYQSEFVRQWWQRAGWRAPKKTAVLANGVDLSHFKPLGAAVSGTKARRIDVLCVEGHIDYSPYAIQLLNVLAERLDGSDIRIRLYGGFADEGARHSLSARIDYRGMVRRSEVHLVYRDSVYLSLDINPACPNTVIEAMSCGLPVVGFRTGALQELVADGCGKVVDYGSDPWALGFPDVSALEDAILEVIAGYDSFSKNARQHAEENFDIRQITGRYIDLIQQAIAEKSATR